MRLDRLRARIRRQDWFAIALEFAIVVTSLLLAFQLDRWWEAHQEQARIHGYLQQLLVDLDADRDELRTTMRMADRHSHAAQLLLDSRQDPVRVVADPTRFIDAVRLSGYAYMPRANRQTYDELLSSGMFSAIRQPALKREIAGYYASYERSRQWDELIRTLQAEHWRRSAGLLTGEMELNARLPARQKRTFAGDTALAIHRDLQQRPDLLALLPQLLAGQQRLGDDARAAMARRDALVASVHRVAD